MGEDMHENGPHFRGPFLNEFHLAVLIPSHATWEAEFAINLIEALHAMAAVPIGRNQSYYIRNLQTSLLPYSREQMVYDCLTNHPQVTHLLFLDQDNTFPQDAIHWLAYRQEPIVVGNYVRRTVPVSPIAKGMDDRPACTFPDSTGLEEVKGGGLGVALFERHVFERVPRPWFDLEWREDGATPGPPRMDGEDIWLFDRCRESGFKVMLDHDLSQHIGHIGRFKYTNQMLDERQYREAENVVQIAK